MKLFWIQNNILFLAYIFISTIMLILKYGVVLESTNQPFSTTNALYLYNVCTDNFPALGKYLLIFMIINMGQELDNNTLGKNLMDGLSRVEYLNSKLLLVICLSLAVLLFELLRIVLIGVVFPFDFLELLSYFTLKDFVDPLTIILFSGISGVFIAIVFGKIVYGLIFYFILNFILISNNISKKMHEYPESIKNIPIIDEVVSISEEKDSIFNNMHPDQAMLVMLTSPGCKPCIQQMDTLNKLASQYDEIEYIVVTSMPMEEKEEKYSNLKFSFFKKINRNPVFEYLQSLKFNKQSVTPITILIRNNRIQDYLIGYNESTLEIIDAFRTTESSNEDSDPI